MKKDKQIKNLENKAHYLRNLTYDMCVEAGTGHVTSSFSSVEMLTALYFGGLLNYDPKNPQWEGRDRFILSKGQASPILYVILAEAGFFPISYLNKFCKKDAKFGVHLQCDVPGVEITSGSLGHGLGIAAGMALADKMDKKQRYTIALLGDAECYEGAVWEAAMFASHNKLNNLIAIIDRNWLGVTDFTENMVKLNPFEEKWKSFGWDAKTINGHSFKQIFDAFGNYRSFTRDKPYVIIAETTKGKGIPSMENIILWHGMAPIGEEAKKMKEELNRRSNKNE